MSLRDPIGTDKEGNEITLIDILGSEADDVIKEVNLKIEKRKLQHLLCSLSTYELLLLFYRTQKLNKYN